METITLSKEVQKTLRKLDINEDIFFSQAERYINAIRENRMCCIITSVSKSGMSRNMKFIEFNNGYMTFYVLFKGLGYSNKEDSFRVNGCGMDMVFHTNYTIIHNLSRMGFISKEECDILAQKTPVIL